MMSFVFRSVAQYLSAIGIIIMLLSIILYNLAFMQDKAIIKKTKKLLEAEYLFNVNEIKLSNKKHIFDLKNI